MIKACQHITNYTAGHETQTQEFGADRFDFPENHIEADNRLTWHLGRLNDEFGREPFYVHLKRNRQAVAKSFMSRFYLPGSMIDAFTEGIHKIPPEKLSEKERKQACLDYVDSVNSNIELFLADKPNRLDIHLEHIQEDFPKFWKAIGAEGDLSAALKEFEKKHNSTSRRKLNLIYRLKLYAKRELRHWKLAWKEE